MSEHSWEDYPSVEPLMMVTVLHISDLHRDSANPVTNEALLHSLKCDLERYTQEDPKISSPDLIIVSGDLIQGVPAHAHNPDAGLRSQYEQALHFLETLTDSLLGGNRERVILVPGNHDVSLPHSARSMKPLPATTESEEVITKHVKELFSTHSMMRWSWETLSFHRVINAGDYLERFSPFVDFYHRFYAGRRAYSLKPEEQFDVFDYPEWNVSVVGFNSCFNNDPLNRQGTIHPDCIARASRLLSAPQYRSRLFLAVWHHNVNGGPLDSDYMDADTLQILIDSGFSIGFHGHQHRPYCIDERFKFGADRKVTVISAGTLCGGPTALPTGQARCYNIVTLDIEESTGRLHQRRMANETFGRPIWGPGQFTSSGRSFVDFAVQPPLPRNVRAQVTAELSKAERLIAEGHISEAISLLRPLAKDEPLARRFLLECYSTAGDDPGIVRDFDPPQSSGEIVNLLDALWNTKHTGRLRELLYDPSIVTHPDPTVRQVREKHLQRFTQ